MKYFFPLAVFFLLVGCSKKKIEKQAEKEAHTIQEYSALHGLVGTTTESGLFVVIDQPGTGAVCSSVSDVVVNYKGYYTNGEIFDQSPTSGVQFNLQQVILGWTEGIPYFREGGKGKLLIPSNLAYGEDGVGDIPGNTVLIFDIELLQVL